MPYYSDLYYKFKRSASAYTYTPTGQLNINRLIQNKPYWRKRSNKTQELKKTLILADWTAGSWDEEKITKVKKVLEDLLKQGFIIYVQQENKVIPLKQIDLIDDAEIRKKMWPLLNSTMLNQMIRENKLTKNTVQVIDDYWLEKTIEGFVHLRVLDSHYLSELNDRDQAVILSAMDKMTPKLGFIRVNEFSEDHINFVNQIMQLKPEITVVHEYNKTLKITKKMISDLIKHGNISISDQSVDLDSLENFENVTIVGSDSENIKWLLNKLKEIKRLTFSGCDIDNSIIMENLNLSSLVELNITGKITASTLNYILSRATNLKKLNLSDCKIEGDLFDKFKLPLLEELTLSKTKMSETTAKSIMSAPSKIKKLKINEFAYPNIIVNMSSQLEFIEDLDLSDSTIEDDAMWTMIEYKKYLKKLNLFNTKIKHASLGGNFQPSTYITTLEELTLSDDLKDELYVFLIKNEKLKKMYLKGDFIEELKKSLLSIRGNPFHFEKVTIDLSGTNILTTGMIPTVNDISYLVSNYNIKELNLKNINLDLNEKLYGNFKKQLDSYPSPLERLCLMNLTISMEVLNDLVSYSKNLKYLEFKNCTIVGANQSLLNEFLSILKEEKGIEVYCSDDYDDSPEVTSHGKATTFDRSKPHPERENAEASVDADTSNTSPTYKLNQIFWGHHHNPQVSDYRLKVYHRLDLKDEPVSINQAFNLNNKEMDLELTDFNIPQRNDIDVVHEWNQSKENENLYYGKMKLHLDSQWQALPSLSSRDKMLQYHINSLVPCEVKYSERDNLYYIRSLDNDSHHVKIDFILESPPKEHKKLLDPHLDKLIQHYKNFGSGSHSFKGPGTTQEYLDAINNANNGKGAGRCSQRSIALMDAIQHHKKENKLNNNIQCRYIRNDCHAYVEIKEDQDAPWIAYNLGGYPARLDINKNNKPAGFDVSQDFNSSPDFIVQTHDDPDKEKYDIDYFSEKLKTWEDSALLPNSTLEYLNHLVKKDNKKQLIKLSSTDQVLSLALALENHAHHTSRPVYYIHSPDDLVCSEPFVKRTGNRGKLTIGEDGQGGPLHEFLTHQWPDDSPPILIVNYDNFEADDIVRLNSLLDEPEPEADGTPINKFNQTSVIGIINSDKPNCYQGKDFYSRFGKGNISTCPFSADALFQLPYIPQRENTHEDNISINLFHAEDWEERLLGRWRVKGSEFVFEEGLLKKAVEEAIASGKSIEIQNGLWDDASFCHFWNRALTLPYIQAYEEKFQLSKVSYVQSEGYDWQYLKTNLIVDNELKSDAMTLNPTKLNEFFIQYKCIASNELDTVPGLLEEYAEKYPHQTLDVNLTRTLDEDEWAELLTECKKNKIILQCHVAPSVTLPDKLDIDIVAAKPLPHPELVIQTADVDVTIAQLTEKEKYKIIDVSELSSNELIKKLAGERKNITEEGKVKAIIEYTESDGIVETALKKNEKIILRGKISEEISDVIAPYLLNQNNNLRIVTTDAAYLAFANIAYHHVTNDEKYKTLQDKKIASDEEIAKLGDLTDISFTKARAKLRAKDRNPWEGLREISGGVKLKPFDENNTEVISQAFIDKRLKDIDEALDRAPYVMLTGLTGVGKSTFLDEEIEKHTKGKLYKGESKIKKWANNNDSSLKILFLDEANLSEKEWSEFYGLNGDPPSITVDNEYIELTPNHKVFFGVNPLNYGGERISHGDEKTLAPFFEGNGNPLVFDPMPPEFIYEKMLKPIFARTSIEKDSLVISKEILRLYQFLCDHSEDEVLISPREIEMIALMVLSHMEQYPDDDLINTVRHYNVVIAKNLVPEEYRKQFENEFPDAPIKRALQPLPKKFILTKSRQPLYEHLSDLLALRKYRRELAATNVKATKKEKSKLYGGLGGILIEGEPGVGKSDIVIKNLIAHGYEEVKVGHKSNKENIFYRMSINMSTEKKMELLLEAFDLGAIVVVDEINSAPMMERMLNDLLMHKRPQSKKSKQRPNKPGFMIIGTQNEAASLEGRSEASPAIKHRMTSEELIPYPEHELKEVLLGLEVEEKYVAPMAKAFQKNELKAKRESLTPEPAIRDLIRFAKKWVAKMKDKLTLSAAKSQVTTTTTTTPIRPTTTTTPIRPTTTTTLTTPTTTFSSSSLFASKTKRQQHQDLVDKIDAQLKDYSDAIIKEQASRYYVDVGKINEWIYKINILNVVKAVLTDKALPEDLREEEKNYSKKMDRWFSTVDEVDELIYSVKKRKNIPLDWAQYEVSKGSTQKK